MSRLTVGSLEGLSENSNVISVPTGHTLNAVDGLQIGGVALGTPTSYTPSHNNITVGNGTEIARYVKIGKLVLVSYKLTWGSTTSFSNYPNVGLPFTANAVAFGSGMMTDTGSSNYQMLVVIDAGLNSVSIRGHNISGTYARADSFTNATTPFTWTTGDILQFSLVYEAQ